MRLRIEVNLDDSDIKTAIAILSGLEEKITKETVKRFLKDRMRDGIADSLENMDSVYRDPSFKFEMYYEDAGTKLREIYAK